MNRVLELAQEKSPTAVCTEQMLAILRETATRPDPRIEPGQYPEEEHMLADANLGIALAARMAMPEHEWADLLMGQLRKLAAICPHVDRSRAPWNRKYHPRWS